MPFRHGFPLDTPNDPAKQRRVIVTALSMLEDHTLTPPALKDYEAGGGSG